MSHGLSLLLSLLSRLRSKPRSLSQERRRESACESDPECASGLSRDLLHLHLPCPRSRVEFVLVQRESLRFAPIILAWKQVRWSPC
ncbi:hypothetical protein GUJ93_ZPchr0014g47562 [Zizania palustris]|uniref:Secreted protein n=1 Tax=Zizania palustris TaxID=103762 RepID=A0A8J5TG51_ZIZPA|nr:hypothetical protein GUJ93_ZPchr0014g47562 [Zizania palustris]